MNSLVKFYFEMLLLRVNPQDCPSSKALQTVLVGIYLLVSIVASIPAWGVLGAMVRSVLDVIILIAFLYLLLRRRRERIHQTLNAMLGCGTIFAAISSVLTFFLLSGEGEQVAASSPSGLLLFGLLCWMVLVFGHILRHALEVTFGSATLTAFLYLVASAFLVHWVTAGLGLS